MATYIYSIVQSESPRALTTCGLEGKSVYRVKFRDLSAVVSDSEIVNFDNLSKEEMMSCVVCHQKVNEELLKDHDIVPMAFGMTAENEEDVVSTLTKAYLQFKRALKKIEGKAEFIVQAFWDEKTVLQEVVNSNSEIKRIRQEAESGGKIRGIAARVKLGKLVMEMLKAYKDHYNKEIEEKLKGCSYDMRRVKLRDRNTVSNLSLLVDKCREDELDKRMQSLGDEFKDTLRFKYIGPMAPGSFVNISLSTGNFELLNSARQVLGVPEKATFDEVKGMYLGLARKYHPDRHEYVNDPKLLKEMTQRMQEIQEAYEALASYCHYVSPGSASGTYSFLEQDIEKALVVREL